MHRKPAPESMKDPLAGYLGLIRTGHECRGEDTCSPAIVGEKAAERSLLALRTVRWRRAAGNRGLSRRLLLLHLHLPLLHLLQHLLGSLHTLLRPGGRLFRFDGVLVGVLIGILFWGFGVGTVRGNISGLLLWRRNISGLSHDGLSRLPLRI